VLIFEMAAGYPPFYSENKVEIFRAICAAQYTCPEHFSKVLAACILCLGQDDRNDTATAQHSISAAVHNGGISLNQTLVDFQSLFARTCATNDCFMPAFAAGVHAAVLQCRI